MESYSRIDSYSSLNPSSLFLPLSPAPATPPKRSLAFEPSVTPPLRSSPHEPFVTPPLRLSTQDLNVSTAVKRLFNDISHSPPLSHAKRFCSARGDNTTLSCNSLTEAIIEQNSSEVLEYLSRLSSSEDAGLVLVEAIRAAIKDKSWNMVLLLVNSPLFNTLIQGGEWSPPWKLVMDKPDILIEMLNRGLFSTLEPIEHGEILKSAIEKQHSSLVARLIDLGISPKKRGQAVNYGVNVNDAVIVSQALRGCTGQRRLTSRQLKNSSEEASCFKIILGQECYGGSNNIINDLRATSRLSSVNYDIAKRHIILGHYWHLDGEYTVNGQKEDYSGAWTNLFVQSVLKSLSAFYTESYQLSESLLTRLTLTIERLEESYSSNYSAYLAGQPVLISTGSEDHAIFIVLWKGLLLVCNLGFKSIIPIEVYEIDESLVTKDILFEIGNEIKELSEIRNHFYTEIPALIGGCFSNDLSYAFSSHWKGISSQTVGNCTWTSFIAGLIGIAGLNSGFDEQTRTHNVDKLLKADGIKKALEDFYIWQEYHRLTEFNDYFSIDALRREKSDPDLADRIFEKIKKLSEVYKNYPVLNRLFRQIKQKKMQS